MTVIRNLWDTFWSGMATVFSTFKLQDILDILIVAYIIYHLVRLVRETRAMQLIKGIVAVLIVYFVAQIVQLITLNFLIQNILSWGIIVLAIVFQPELRRALEQMGRTKLGSVLIRSGEMPADLITATEQTIQALEESCSWLSEHKIGALMVIERDTRLGEIIKTGTVVDAKPGLEMIANLFFPNSPLHDGAVVIREGRLLAAGCFLPLSSNMDIGRELGTRHRAALGMSEVSDAVVVVVSEETGAITVALDGKLQRGLSVKNLGRLLTAKLLPAPKTEEKTTGSKLAFWRKKQK